MTPPFAAVRSATAPTRCAVHEARFRTLVIGPPCLGFEKPPHGLSPRPGTPCRSKRHRSGWSDQCLLHRNATHAGVRHGLANRGGVRCMLFSPWCPTGGTGAKNFEQVHLYMNIRKKKSQELAAAKAGISERSARRIEGAVTLPSQNPRRYWRSRADPFTDVSHPARTGLCLHRYRFSWPECCLASSVTDHSGWRDEGDRRWSLSRQRASAPSRAESQVRAGR